MTVPCHASGTEQAGIDALLHLRRSGVRLLLDTAGPELPVVLRWGAGLGSLIGAELADLANALRRPVCHGTPDGRPVGIVPEHTRARFGMPGLSGHREGRDWSPYFRQTGVRMIDRPGSDQAVVIIEVENPATGVELYKR